MSGRRNRKANSINRRSFVGTTVKLVTFGTLLMPLVEACNNKKSAKPTLPDREKDKKGTTASSKKPRKKWSHEGLVINTKTNVLHLPTSKVYHYYDEIRPNHLKEISRAAWNPVAENAPKLNRQQSGNILEILTLNHLNQGINDEYLDAATDTLAIAFTAGCENSKAVNLNTTNFRLHELMLQLITLNTGILATDKWQVFNSKIKKPAALRKRQKWMEIETSFNERVKYILDRQTDYINRLTERARKYSFT
jgi:hypothetical protein